ncbi:MAG: hypothetical protein ACR2H5_07395 [Ktedonobacteraceae bacterium]
MRQDIETIFYTVLVIAAAIGLCLLVPVLTLLEIFLVLLGGLILGVAALVVNKEICELKDLKHMHEFRRKLREIKLARRKQQLLLGGLQQVPRRRKLYYH